MSLHYGKPGDFTAEYSVLASIYKVQEVTILKGYRNVLCSGPLFVSNLIIL